MDETNKIISTEDIETNETDGAIPDKPCKAKCEECRAFTITHMKKSFNIYAFLLAFLIIHIYGIIYGIPLLIILIPLCQDIIHACPSCGTTLLKDKFCNIKLQEKNKFIWLQYGNCILIFRLIYVTIIGILIILLGVFNYTTYLLNEKSDELIKNIHNHDHSHINELFNATNLSWEDLINDCGGKVMVENSARANEIFNRKFFKKIIEWKGYFLSAYIQAYNPLDFNPEHILNLNIRMIPSESLKNADLFLSLDTSKYNKYLNEIRKLKTGDPIIFKASFESLGNEWRPHHLHLIHVNKIDDFIDADKKVVLFKGINFDISGHLKNEKIINEIKFSNEENINKKSNDTVIEEVEENKLENENKVFNDSLKAENFTKMNN